MTHSLDPQFPDLVVYEPRGRQHGLCPKLKREGTRVFLKLHHL
jgi:hypothetical protein